MRGHHFALSSVADTVGIQLAYSWHTVGIQLAYSWHIVGIQLAYSWQSVDIQLAYSWHTVGIQLASIVGTNMTIHLTVKVSIMIILFRIISLSTIDVYWFQKVCIGRML